MVHNACMPVGVAPTRAARNRLFHTVAVFALGSWCGSPCVSGADGGAVNVLAVGNDRVVWLCERRVENQVSALRLAYCQVADSGELAFRPLRLPPLSGSVAAAAARDENLHVFFSDGAHVRFVPPSGTRILTQSKVRGSEVGLPGRAVPRALVPDASMQTLYALVLGDVAVRLRGEVASDGDLREASADSESDGGEVERESLETERMDDSVGRVVEAPYAFVRYEGGAWLFDRWAPDDVEDGTDVLAVWVRDGEASLLYRRGGVAEWTYQLSPSREEAWAGSEAVGIPSTARGIGAGWTSTGPVVVVREGGGRGAGVGGYRKEAGGWTALPPLSATLDSRAALERSSSSMLMGRRVVTVGVSPAGAVEAGSWSVTTGEELNAVGPVLAFAPSPTPWVDDRIREYVPFLVFAFVLVFVFITRRDRGLFRVALGPTDQVADLQARFFALLLDFLITAPLWGGFLYIFRYDDLAALSTFEQIRSPTPALALILPVVSVSEAFYSLVFEIVMRATPGKRIMGLCVVAEGGGRASGGAIVARNLMRVLEFKFMAVAILVFLTPSRQRLGDVLARTLVVQRVSVPVDEATQKPEPSGDKK